MSNEHKKGPGAHYSGANPVPNIQRFIESLDADKKQRDAKNAEISGEQANQTVGPTELDSHKNVRPQGNVGTKKTVTDPTTGRQVQIEDVNSQFVKSADNPKVSLMLLHV